MSKCDNTIDQSSKGYVATQQKLICSNCQLLTNIPHIQGLRILNCSECPLLTNIPTIQG